MSARPPLPTQVSVYTNLLHELDGHTVAELEREPNFYAAHYAWNFCGYVWCEDGRWHEEVWVHKQPVATFEGDSVMAVIDQANDVYGRA